MTTKTPHHMASQMPPKAFASVALFGGLGLIPFAAPLLAPAAAPALRAAADHAQTAYAALILSFLGGARFGRALEDAAATGDLALAMLPPIAALGALLLPLAAETRLVLICALVGQLAWDGTTRALPASYRRLRALLTMLAVVALALGLFAFHRAKGA